MIDLRSDTVTQPDQAMRAAMLSAPLGDDVYGDDPTVNQLEETMAVMTGKAAALFLASGTQSNLCALLSHCQRGDEYIAGQDAHTYKYEAGGGAVLGGIQPQPLAFNSAGEIPLLDIERAIKPDDFHFAKTRLLCLENTVGGQAVSQDYMLEATNLARRFGIACHLDGARLFNAAEKLHLDIKELSQPFDSISICLSKGLGSPAGSVLVGDYELIAQARRWRKMLGGGMRQAGILAAAGLYALEHNVLTIADDHAKANHLGASLEGLPGFELAKPVDTNMVFLKLSAEEIAELAPFLLEKGIKVSTNRLVVHRDISTADLERVIQAFKQFSARSKKAN
ncbi:MAG: low-specificity L-threonine aldolase [Pseudomonadales bacterium]